MPGPCLWRLQHSLQFSGVWWLIICWTEIRKKSQILLILPWVRLQRLMYQVGRLDWHIECGAMSTHYLTHSFDVHCGGIDVIFPHHKEMTFHCTGSYSIAPSLGLRVLVIIWLHLLLAIRPQNALTGCLMCWKQTLLMICVRLQF